MSTLVIDATRLFKLGASVLTDGWLQLAHHQFSLWCPQHLLNWEAWVRVRAPQKQRMRNLKVASTSLRSPPPQ